MSYTQSNPLYQIARSWKPAGIRIKRFTCQGRRLFSHNCVISHLQPPNATLDVRDLDQDSRSLRQPYTVRHQKTKGERCTSFPKGTVQDWLGGRNAQECRKTSLEHPRHVSWLLLQRCQHPTTNWSELMPNSTSRWGKLQLKFGVSALAHGTYGTWQVATIWSSAKDCLVAPGCVGLGLGFVGSWALRLGSISAVVNTCKCQNGRPFGEICSPFLFILMFGCFRTFDVHMTHMFKVFGFSSYSTFKLLYCWIRAELVCLGGCKYKK